MSRAFGEAEPSFGIGKPRLAHRGYQNFFLKLIHDEELASLLSAGELSHTA